MHAYYNYNTIDEGEKKRLVDLLVKAGRVAKGLCLRIKHGKIRDARLCEPRDILYLEKRGDEVYIELSDDVTTVIERAPEHGDEMASLILNFSTEPIYPEDDTLYDLIKLVDQLRWAPVSPRDFLRIEEDKKIEIEKWFAGGQGAKPDEEIRVRFKAEVR